MNVAESPAHQGIGVYIGTAAVGTLGITEPDKCIALLPGPCGRKTNRVSPHRVIEQIGQTLYRGMAEMELGVHTQAQARGRSDLCRDIALEQVFLIIDVSVEFRGIGRVEDAILIVERSVQEVIDPLPAAGNVGIHILVHRVILEQRFVPVIVWIDIGIPPLSGTIYFILRIVHRAGGFIVSLHESDAVGNLLYAGGH